MGMACLACLPPIGLPAAEPLLGQGCGSSRSASSIKQALASYQRQLSNDAMLTDDDTPSGPPGSMGAAGGLEAPGAATHEGSQRTPQAAGEALHPSGLELGLDATAQQRDPSPADAAASAGGCGGLPIWPPAAAAAAAPCSMIEQLQSALSMWEELKANARTPSTVLRTPLAPQLVECSSSAALQCSCA
jgi:hypothetical protein